MAKFDAVWSKTDVTMTISVVYLNEMIALCVNLKARIEVKVKSIRQVELR